MSCCNYSDPGFRRHNAFLFKCKKHIFLGSILKVEGLPNLKLEMSDATAERTATACVAEEPMVEYRQDVICENRFFGWSTATGLKNRYRLQDAGMNYNKPFCAPCQIAW